MSAVSKIQRILFATDFSEPAEHAQRYACELADKLQAELHLLHVHVPVVMPAMGAPTFGYVESPPIVAEVEGNMLRRLASLLDSEWQANHRVVTAVRVGMTVFEIIRYAEENQIDLIVMGTLGRTGLTHLLLGSVAENVVRKAHCPVFTVRPPNPEGIAG